MYVGYTCTLSLLLIRTLFVVDEINIIQRDMSKCGVLGFDFRPELMISTTCHADHMEDPASGLVHLTGEDRAGSSCAITILCDHAVS